jgi:outer membrane protein assembly factor BamB
MTSRVRHRWLLFILAAVSGLGVLVVLQLLGKAPWQPYDLYLKPRGPRVQVVWTFEQPQRGAVISSPLAAGERVYVAAVRDLGPASFGAVYALDRATGKVLWRFDADGTMQQTYSTPCLSAGRLYLGEGMHGNHVCKFYCLDAETGRELWHRQTADHIESSPCVAGGRVCFGAGDDGFYCLDAVTGKECWHLRGSAHVDAGPTPVGDWVYFGSGVTESHKAPGVFCLNLATGEPRWYVATDLPVWGAIAADGDRIFVPLGNGRLLEPAAPPERPAGALLCLDTATHRELWRFPVGDAVLARPTVDKHRVIFGCRDGICTCLDRDGRLCWKAGLGSPVVTRVASRDGDLYVAPLGGPVTCLDAGTGKVLWTFDLAARSQCTPQLLASPAVAGPDDAYPYGRRIYVGAELKNAFNSAAVVYCLED